MAAKIKEVKSPTDMFTCILAELEPAGFDEYTNHKWKCLSFSAFNVSEWLSGQTKPGQNV